MNNLLSAIDQFTKFIKDDSTARQDIAIRTINFEQTNKTNELFDSFVNEPDLAKKKEKQNMLIQQAIRTGRTDLLPIAAGITDSLTKEKMNEESYKFSRQLYGDVEVEDKDGKTRRLIDSELSKDIENLPNAEWKLTALTNLVNARQKKETGATAGLTSGEESKLGQYRVDVFTSDNEFESYYYNKGRITNKEGQDAELKSASGRDKLNALLLRADEMEKQRIENEKNRRNSLSIAGLNRKYETEQVMNTNAWSYDTGEKLIVTKEVDKNGKAVVKYKNSKGDYVDGDAILYREPSKHLALLYQTHIYPQLQELAEAMTSLQDDDFLFPDKYWDVDEAGTIEDGEKSATLYPFSNPKNKVPSLVNVKVIGEQLLNSDGSSLSDSEKAAKDKYVQFAALKKEFDDLTDQYLRSPFIGDEEKSNVGVVKAAVNKPSDDQVIKYILSDPTAN